MSLVSLGATLLSAVSACGICAAGGAMAADAPLPNVFTFAAGYRLDTPGPRNLVEYGVVGKCGTEWCIDVERYDSARLLAREVTAYTHAMRAPYGSACVNGPIARVHRDAVEAGKATLRRDAAGIVVDAGKYRYRWESDASAPNGYRLAGAEYEGSKLDQVVGFAFSSARALVGDISPAQVDATFQGEIHAKTALTGVAGDWQSKASSLHFQRFRETDNGAVLALSEPGLAAVVKKYGARMWVHNSIILKRERKPVAPLVQEYGHDFNRDGCFNEPGHNKMMLPIGSDNVTALVYIEYTSDFLRGFPMLSVGRYYR